MPGRFYLGLGTGENLNEHITGERWPPADVRLKMLEEAVEVIRLLWRGEEASHYGRYYTVDHARIYSLPDELPPIYVAAKGENATKLAAQNDGLISTSPDEEQVHLFQKEGGEGKPRMGMIHVCWAEDDDQAKKIAMDWWPNSALKGELSVELPLPRHFEQASENVAEKDVLETTICSSAPEPHLEAIQKFEKAGFDQAYVHQVGPDQEGFFDFYKREILPNLK
jgi:coenzyme F420-dependent glucose-6-phosphate dehydrogenase